MTQEALKLAFEKVTGIPDAWTNPALMQARNGFIQGWEAKEALAQKQEPVDLQTRWPMKNWKENKTTPPQRTEQEPVAWMDADGNVSDNNDHKCFPIPLYTHPPQRTWVGLTDEEKSELWEISRAALPRYATYASLVEAKLKEKNT